MRYARWIFAEVTTRGGMAIDPAQVRRERSVVEVAFHAVEGPRTIHGLNLYRDGRKREPVTRSTTP